jgi:MFS family permease
MRERLHIVAGVIGSAFRNRDLRDIGFAYALFSAAEFGAWITFLIYAFDRGGSNAVLVISLVQLVPCVLLGPTIGAMVERWTPARSLVTGYLLQVVALGGVAAAVAAHAPYAVVVALTPLTALAITVTRPAQSAVLPAVVCTAEELTAANVMTGWTESAAALVGPVLVGIALDIRGVVAALIIMAVLPLGSLLLSGRAVRRLTRRGLTATAPEHGDAGVTALLRTSLSRTFGDPGIRVLLIITTFFWVLMGALDFLSVVVAIQVLHTGPGGPGFLNAAVGAGGLAAASLTAFLVGRHPLSPTLVISLLASVGVLALVALRPSTALAVVLFVGVGVGTAVFSATGRTLMQRAAPADAIAGSFAVVEACMDLGLGLGGLLAWAGVQLVGPRAALVAPAVAAVALLAALGRSIRQVDASATVPQVEIRLLRSIRIFAPLPAPTIELVARELVPMAVSAGTRVITEGDPGDQYFAVADGELDITRAGRRLHRVGRGDGFGEVALVRDVPRTASVTATTDCLLYGLDGDVFMETVTANASAGRVAVDVVDGHLRDRRHREGEVQDQPGAPGPRTDESTS